MDISQSAGRPVSFMGYSGEGQAKVPFAVARTAYEIVTLGGRTGASADWVHSNTEAERLWSLRARMEDFERIVLSEGSLELFTAAWLIAPLYSWRYLAYIYRLKIPNLRSFRMAICCAMSRPFLCPIVEKLRIFSVKERFREAF